MAKKEQGKTVSAFAMDNGHDRRTVKRRVDAAGIKPCRKKSGVKFYTAADLATAMNAWEAAKPEGISAQMAEAKLKERQAKARTAEVEAKKAEGSVVDLSEAKRTFVRAAIVVKTKMMAIPSSVSQLLVGKSLIEIEQKLRAAMIEALQELSEHKWNKSKSSNPKN